MVLKQRLVDHLSYEQIYRIIADLKLLYMPSKQKYEIGILKFVNVGTVSVTRETQLIFKCYEKNLERKLKIIIRSISSFIFHIFWL